MKYLKITFLSLVLAISVLIPTTQVQAQTTSNQAAVSARIAELQTQLRALQQQLLLLRQQNSDGCYTDNTRGIRYCPTTQQQDSADADDIETIEVDFVGDIAQVRVEFDEEDTEFYAIEADTLDEVARLLAPELDLSTATTLHLLDEVNNSDRDDDDNDDDSDDEDIRSIDVTFDDDDADVVVRFEDGGSDRFTLSDVDEDEDEVIEELADRYNEDEDDIEDWTDFEDDDDDTDDNDIRSIDVEFDDDAADVTVRYRSGYTETFTLNNVYEDEDDVIELIADRYNMDEDDVEDLIDFE